MADFVKNEELCQRYAQFASHMMRWQFKIIYWSMFMTNLVVLFLASWILIRCALELVSVGINADVLGADKQLWKS